MADWKENKIVGVVAVIVFVISMVILTNSLIKRQRGTPLSPEQKARIEKEIEAMQRPGKR